MVVYTYMLSWSCKRIVVIPSKRRHVGRGFDSHPVHQKHFMNKYLIRFNHHHQESLIPGYVWRVFENDQTKAQVVRGLRISVPVFDEMSIEDGIEKWNVACFGSMQIIDGIAYIK